jgi:hypothetical protein
VHKRTLPCTAAATANVHGGRLAEGESPCTNEERAFHMQSLFSQIVIGIIVTVVGTVVANAIVRGPNGRHFMAGYHFSSHR